MPQINAQALSATSEETGVEAGLAVGGVNVNAAKVFVDTGAEIPAARVACLSGPPLMPLTMTAPIEVATTNKSMLIPARRVDLGIPANFVIFADRSLY